MAKQVTRYRRKKKSMVDAWPESLPQPAWLAERVRYVGSQEHKDYPSYAGEPGLRSDASRCDPAITQDQAEKVLKQAIRLGCVSEQHEGDFPRYVWGRLDGVLYQARLINRENGWYKAWAIDALEAPRDPVGRLNLEHWHV